MKRFAFRPPATGILFWLVAGFLTSGLDVHGHDLFTAYIQHRVGIVVSSKYIDISVQLTFFEEGAERERRKIDVNADGKLTRAEIDAYLTKIELEVASAVSLTIAGRPVTVMPLRAPELDLLGQDRAGTGHLRLILCYFGLTPAELSPGTDVLISDRLWPEVRALCSIESAGRDNCRVEPLSSSDPVYPPAKDGEARCFKARVLAPPVAAARDAARQGGRVQKNPPRIDAARP